MTQYTLTLIDTAGIQEYIFGSNNLAQNIGASELVMQATRDWAFEALEELGLRHNGKWLEAVQEWDIMDQSIASDRLDAEVIYAGGGNAVLLFADDKQRIEFVKRLTLRALRDATGLRLQVNTEQITWEANDLPAKLKGLRETVGMHSLPRPASLPLLGLGVTAACDYTAQPVYQSHVEESGEVRAISREVYCKLSTTVAGRERLHRVLPGVRGKCFEFIYDFDQFGTPGESSYIAVIHADGNRMGDRFRGVRGKDNTEYVQNLRAFSKSIQKSAQTALQTTAATLIKAYEHGDLTKEVHAPEHPTKTGWYLLPFRPIVFGGDDVTFVADGRLGLTLAAIYLKAFLDKGKKEMLLRDGKPLYSRAGVAVVKSHYPFSRAYQLAEALGRESKKVILQNDAMAMDWHFSTSGAVLELNEIRTREYTDHKGRSLLMRPVRVGSFHPGDWQTWENFVKATNAFRKDEWAGRRNKVKALRDALRAGESAVQQFLTNYGIDNLPPIDGLDTMHQKGWQDNRCGYFDAIEAMDLFIDLEGRTA